MRLQTVLALLVSVALLEGASAAKGESPWSQVVPAGVSPEPRRSHVSLLLEIRDEIFIFGGSSFECKICKGGDIGSEGKACSDQAAIGSDGGGVCTGGGTCQRVEYCPMQDSWIFNILSFRFTPMEFPSIAVPPVESASAALWMPQDPDEIAPLIWGGRTFLRSACPNTPMTAIAFSATCGS